MLGRLSEEIRACLEHAEACARRAETAFCEEMREDFLRLEKSWLTLARGYESAAKLRDFTGEHERKRGEWQGP